MIFFDNQTNNTSCVAGMNGPTVVYTPDGVTRALFEVNYCRSIDRKEGRMTGLKWCRKGSLLFQRQERSWVQHPHGGDNLVWPRFNCFYSATAAPLLIANYIMCSWSDKNGVPKGPRFGMDTFHVIIWAALFVVSKIAKIWYKMSLGLFVSGTRPKVDWFIP